MGTAMAVSIILLSLLGALASAQYCPALHADFLRRQAAKYGSQTPFNETSGAKHTPYISITGTQGTVKVGNGQPYHPMVASSDPNTVHFITTIYVLDQSGGFVAMDVLDPTGVSMAQMQFDIPSSATNLVAYEWCNLHGLWKGPEVSVSPGPNVATCTKSQVDSTAQTSFIADLHRRQAAAPFNSLIPFNESMGSKHTPYIALQGNSGTVTVGNGSPFHPMVASTNPAIVHFITLIYVLDQAGNVVVMKNLDPTSVNKATITFSVPSGATSLTAYEWCNKHGLWKGPMVPVPHVPLSGFGVMMKVGAAAALISGALL